MPTDDIAEVASYMVTMFEDDITIGLKGVSYGDQEKIPQTPWLAVEPGPMDSVTEGASNRQKHTLTMYLILYLARVQSKQVTRSEIDAMIKKVVEVLHSDTQLGVLPDNLVIQSWVTRREPGYARKGGALLNAARITWPGLSRSRVGA